MVKNTEAKELIDRALFASRRKEWDEALVYAEQALALEPANHLAHKRRSLALWYLDRREEALAAMLRSAEIRPDFESAHYNLACFHAQLEKRDLMLSCLRRAIELASEYMDMARKDPAFEVFDDDEDFIALVRPNAGVARDLETVLRSGDLNAITDRLRRLGKDIPVAAVDWERAGEGGDLSKVLCEQAEKLDTDTLVHLYRLIAVDVRHDPYDFDGWHALNRVLQQRDGARFEALLVETWKKRYAETDAGHLAAIEQVMLAFLDQCPPPVKATVALEAIRSHGPDAVRDYATICASSLEELSDESALAEELVDVLDRAMHSTTYVDEDVARRRTRVALTLPPPPLDVPTDSDDPWIRERMALESFHPQHVVRAAESLSIQRDPAARTILEEHQGRLADLVRDDTMSEDVRLSAADVLEKIASSETLASLAPALNDPSPKVLFAVGSAMRAGEVNLDPSVPALQLISLLDDIADWLDRHDVIRALRWFPTSESTRVLVNALQERQEAIRREALYGLGVHGSADTVEAIVGQLVGGSGQCITAAADALARMGIPEATAALQHEETYRAVLASAKKSPRWATRALTFFDVPSLPTDLFELFCTTTEAVAHLAHGISLHPSESVLPSLVELGLDTFRLEKRAGRYLVEIARAAVSANPEGPSPEVRDRLVDLLSGARSRAITDLIEHVDDDVRYATERASEPAAAATQRVDYARRLEVVLAAISQEAARLPRSLFGVSKDASRS